MQSSSPTIRTYRVGVRGFDFDHVLVMARSRGRARYLCALAYADADWGSVTDGLRHVVSCRIDNKINAALIYPQRGPEGLARAQGGPTR